MSVEPQGRMPLYRFCWPRYWPMWLLLGCLRLAVALPLRVQLAVGRRFGPALQALTSRRRRVADANLRLCFPERTQAERDDIVRRHFASLGMMLFELAMAWWANDRRLARMTHLEGLDNLLRPLGEGRGVVVLSGHFAGQEICGRVVPVNSDKVAAVYRRGDASFFDEWLRRGRLRAVPYLIPKEDVRQMIRLLRGGWAIWYAPDQSYRKKHSALVPFFGEPAMTSTALSDIVRMGRAVVVPFFPQRLEGARGYHGVFLPALDDFPSGDVEADARRINRLLEEQIRKAPEQYYWVHRRFKGRPPEFPDPYEQSSLHS